MINIFTEETELSPDKAVKLANMGSNAECSVGLAAKDEGVSFSLAHSVFIFGYINSLRQRIILKSGDPDITFGFVLEMLYKNCKLSHEDLAEMMHVSIRPAGRG